MRATALLTNATYDTRASAKTFPGTEQSAYCRKPGVLIRICPEYGQNGSWWLALYALDIRYDGKKVGWQT